MKELDRITIDSEVCLGQPTIQAFQGKSAGLALDRQVPRPAKAG